MFTYADSTNLSPKMNRTNFVISTFNCRSVKSSVTEVRQLCDRSDIVVLQEHWLLPYELDLLSSIHSDFLYHGQSAVDLSQGLLVGRPYGGTAILYRRNLMPSILPVETFDPRISAVQFDTNLGPVLLLCVYMPPDDGSNDCLENYIATCAKVSVLIADCDTAHRIIAGDFNCQVGSRFYGIFQKLVTDNNLCVSDQDRINNGFTYFNDAGTASSWIDHVLCSQGLDRTVCSVNICLDFISSDHKPLVVDFSQVLVNSSSQVLQAQKNSLPCSVTDWSNVDACSISAYQDCLNTLLSKVNVPTVIQTDPNRKQQYCKDIDDYYDAVMDCVVHACNSSLPSKRVNSACDYITPGWNDYVQDKHAAARSAFLDWVVIGKPRFGHEFQAMKSSRAQFKLALRYCRQHEDVMRADAYAQSLLDKDYKNFWSHIRKSYSGKSTKFATCIAGCSGDAAITDMWLAHYEQLYNSVHDDASQNALYERLSAAASVGGIDDCFFSVSDVVEVCAKQKAGKSAGYDGVAMEAFIYGGSKLCVHLALLFNMFVKYAYIPRAFMQSVIVPLVKCKTGNLSDVNNYRAIAISTAISKLFEHLLSHYVEHIHAIDSYQFGFTAGHSTSLCTYALKQAVDYYTSRGSHVFACFVDFSKAFDKVNYWKLFNKLLDDECNPSIVKVLAFWYSHQEACVRWHNSVSEFFSFGNGTRQGGVLSPRLFARYIRDMISAIVCSGIGCNVGGLMLNILAYADDIVLICPSWRGLQYLLNLLNDEIAKIDMVANPDKSVCMVFAPTRRAYTVAVTFPEFQLGCVHLSYVVKFKYLGHMLVNVNTDDSDIQREISNLFVRTNVLLRRFCKCSQSVKVALFRAYCLCMYDTALWRRYNSTTLGKLRSAYNKCIKIFFGFARRDSLSNMLLLLGLPTFDTVLHNAIFAFSRQSMRCNNRIIKHLHALNAVAF